MSLKKAIVAVSALAGFAVPMVAQASTTSTYVVKPGDTLWKIAHRTGVSVNRLVQANHIAHASRIMVGERLVVSANAGPSHTNGSKQDLVIQTAKKYVGVPYVWGGTTPRGFDCSGFTQYVFSKHGVRLPRVSLSQWHTGKPVASSRLKKGDLVFFGNTYRSGVSHTGIYLGNDKFIEASSSHGVTVANLFTNGYWKSHYLGARDVLS